MDRKSLAERFQDDNLEKYISCEFLAGKTEAESEVKEYIEKVMLEVHKAEDSELKLYKVIENLIANKTSFYSVRKNYFSLIAIESTAQFRQLEENLETNPEKFAIFLLDYFKFKNFSDTRISKLLATVKKDSYLYHTAIFFKLYSQLLFDLLNSLDLKMDSFRWEWTNIESGLVLLLKNKVIDKKSNQYDFEYQIMSLENKSKSEKNKLSDEIRGLKSDLDQSINKFTFYEEANKKYYYNSEIIINNTYFGDNMPFLYTLYAFLRSYNLTQYSWSYFYLCMTVGNNEMIFLEKPKKLNLLGRIFYHLEFYLIPPYRENYFQFIISKFLINGERIEPKFKNNHMSPDYDKTIEKELVKVDVFFREQDKIYIKV